jgi:hypothetical protein
MVCRPITRVTAAIAIIGPMLLTACAPAVPPVISRVGRDFPRAAFARFELKETTDQQAEAVLGPPINRLALKTTAANPAGPVPVGTPIDMAVLRYIYLLDSGGPQAGNRPVVKLATLVFLGGTLAAYDVNSTIPGDDNPPIDDSKLSLLKQGRTTRNDIISLMGTPSGQSAPLPFAPKSMGHITYAWTHFEGTGLRRKILIIDLNSRDVMTHYTLLDGSGPMPAPAPNAPSPFTQPPEPNPETQPSDRQGPLIRS